MKIGPFPQEIKNPLVVGFSPAPDWNLPEIANWAYYGSTLIKSGTAYFGNGQIGNQSYGGGLLGYLDENQNENQIFHAVVMTASRNPLSREFSSLEFRNSVFPDPKASFKPRKAKVYTRSKQCFHPLGIFGLGHNK